MRITLLIIFLALVNWSNAQENKAPHSLVYKLTTEEATHVAIDRSFEIEKLDLFARVPFDTLHNEYDVDELPTGFYASIQLQNLRLSSQLIIVQDLEIKLIRNGKFLTFVFNDKEQLNTIPESVFWNNKRIDLDPITQTFSTRTGKLRGVVKARYEGQDYLFPIQKDNGYGFLKTVGKKTLNFLPIKIITKPFIDIYKSIKYNQSYGTVRSVAKIFNPDLRTRETSYGYIAVNKPKYKPGDTLFYKIKLAKRSGKPLNKSLELNLGNYAKKSFQQQLALKNGEAHGQIHLHDSLDLSLDEYYNITVVDKDQEVLQSISFYYEDYTLKSENYQVLLSKKVHGAEPNKVTLIGKDENEKRVRNVQYRLSVELTDFYPKFSEKPTYVPHTLMTTKGSLSTVEDTEVIIPDSIFQALDTKYQVNVTFINAANDQQVVNQRGEFNASTIPVDLKLVGDSLTFEFPEGGYQGGLLYLRGHTQNWEADATVIPNPGKKVKLNPAIENYSLESEDGSLVRSFSMRQFDAQIQFSYERNAKSVDLRLDNTRKVPLWYSVFKGKRLFEEGQALDSLRLTISASKNQPVTVLYKYLWAGQIMSEREDLPYYNNLINLTADHQKLILPGVTDTIKVKAIDQNAKPVSGVDITAFSITSKFKQNNVPDVPYFGKYKHINFTSTRFSTSYFGRDLINFNYPNWRKSLGLDTIPFYQLAFPKELIKKEFQSKDNKAYISLIAVDNGMPREVSYILMDGEPLHINLAGQHDEGAHQVNEGYHNFKIRTQESMISIDSVFIAAASHTIISVAKKASHPQVSERFGAKREEVWPLSSLEIDMLESRTMHLLSSKRNILRIEQNGKTFKPDYNKSFINAGPLAKDSLSIFLADNSELRMYFEPGYNYEIVQDQIFKKAYSNRRFSFGATSIPTALNFGANSGPVSGVKLRKNEYRTWNNWVRISYFNLTKSGLGLISINPDREAYPQIEEYIILNAEDYSLVRKSSYDRQFSLTDGNYTLITLLDSGFVRDDFAIMEDQTVVVSPNTENLLALDSLYKLFNTEVKAPIARRISPPIITVPLPKLGTDGMVTGTVTGSDDGLPLPQVSIFIKGTKLGTPTNADGTFSLFVPEGATTLVFRFLGYVTQEIRLRDDQVLDVTLVPDATSLGETVVVGYSDLSNMVRGKVAGVAVKKGLNYLDTTPTFQIRGTNQLRTSNSPLIVVDGVLVAGSLADIDMSDVMDVSVMQGSSAAALYGSRAANGVVIITTKKKSLRQEEDRQDDESDGESSKLNIRNNFRDYGYWVPSVKTDKNGEATIVVTYPDDVTSWQNHFLAMSNSGKTGQLKTVTKAYKPVVARLKSPRFLIEGDLSTLYGEIANYSGAKVDLDREFSVSGKSTTLSEISVESGHLDSLSFTASNLDSIEVSYSLKSSSMSDGERLSIPVSPKGIEKNMGEFYVLSNDTLLNLSAPNPDKEVSLTIQSNLLGLFLEDIQTIHDYDYWCNEQTGSKLIALLAEKKLSSKTDQSFNKKAEVNQAIRKLRRGINDENVWGWWEGMSTSYWVTNHVIRALLDAQNEFFNTKLELEKSIATLRNNLPEMNRADLLMSLETILLIDSTAEVAGYLNLLQQTESRSLTEKIKLAKVSQLSGVAQDINWMDSLQQTSLYGGLYFRDSTNGLHNNDVTATLEAYALLKLKNPEDERLKSIRKYLMLNSRSNNTYALSNIIMTIGNDLESNQSSDNLQVNGKTINEFPFKRSYDGDQEISLRKTNNSDAYVSFTQAFWESKPVIQDQLGTISVSFVDKRMNEVNELNSGESYTMRISIDLNEDAKYLMIEAPLIGGTQYASKPKGYMRGEHREYFKEKTNLYFESLEAGKYSFDIQIVAMFPGEYTLNPTQMNLMYTPLISSNNQSKKLSIK